MPLWRFTALTLVGSGLWNAVFIYAGYRLGDRWGQVQQYLQPITYAVLVVLLAGLLYLTITRRSRV